MDSNNQRDSKETYVTPRLRVIELVTDEVLGAGCKNGTSAGPETLCVSGMSPCGNEGS